MTTIEFGGKEDFANLEKTLEVMGSNWKWYQDGVYIIEMDEHFRQIQIPVAMMRDIMITCNIEPF